MTPVEQRHRREVVESALRRLATGQAIPRTELFPLTRLCGPTVNAHKVWSQRIASKLVDMGIAERLGQGTSTSYRLAQTDEAATRLQELSTNVLVLSRVIFGGASGGVSNGSWTPGEPWESLGEAVDGERSAAAGEEGAGAEVEAEEIVEPGSDESVSVRLEFALKVLAAVLENVLYIRDRQMEHGERLKKLEEAFR